MKAKSIKGNSPEEIKAALQQSMADSFAPTLAIVFMSIKQDRKAICDLLDKEGIEIFGSTTAGEFIDSEIEKESTTILLMDVNRSFFNIKKPAVCQVKNISETFHQIQFVFIQRRIGRQAQRNGTHRIPVKI